MPDDGSVTLKVEMDSADVSKELKRIQSEIDDLQKDIKKRQNELTAKERQYEIDENLIKEGEAIDELRQKLKELKKEKEAVNSIDSDTRKQAEALSAKYNNLQDQLQKMKEAGVDPQADKFKKVQDQIQETENKLDDLYSKMAEAAPNFGTSIKESFDGIKEANAQVAQQYTDAFAAKTQKEGMLGEIMKASEQMDKLAEKQSDLEQLGTKTDSTTWKRLQLDIDKTKDKLDELIAKYRELDAQTADGMQGSLDAEYGKLKDNANAYDQAQQAAKQPATANLPALKGTDPKKTAASVSAVNKTFKKGLTTVLKYAFGIRSLYYLFRKLRSAVSEGLSNLQKFNGGANPTATAINSLQNSMTYLKNAWGAAFAPIITAVMPALTQLIDGLAAAANAVARFMAMISGKSAYTKAIKMNKKLGESAQAAGNKALASFDEINAIDQAGGGSSGNDVSGMFQEEQINNASQFETAVAERLQSIMTTMKKTVEAIRDAWKEAWDYNGNGEAIVAVLQAMFLDILNTIQQIATDTLRWAENLNLEPLVTAIRTVLESLQPVLADIGDVLEWIWNSIILPLAKWVAESALPAFLNLIAAGLDVIDAIFQAVAPVMKDIFDSFITPIAGTTGNAIVSILDLITRGLKAVAEWINKHSELVGILTPIVLTAVAAFKLVSPVMGLIRAAGAKLSGVFSVLKGAVSAAGAIFGWIAANPTALIIAAIVAIIAVIALIITHWDLLKEAAKNCAQAISTRWNAMMSWFRSIGSGIIAVFGSIISYLRGAFVSGWTTAWNAVLGVFRSIWNTIARICESVVNGIINGLNSLSFTTPSWFPWGGGQHFGFNLSRVSIPRLATGTVIPPSAGEFAAILGDNNKEPEVVSPLSTMKEALVEALGEYGGDAEVVALLTELVEIERNKRLSISKRDIGEAAVDYVNEQTMRTGNNPIFG